MAQSEEGGKLLNRSYACAAVGVKASSASPRADATLTVAAPDLAAAAVQFEQELAAFGGQWRVTSVKEVAANVVYG